MTVDVRFDDEVVWIGRTDQPSESSISIPRAAWGQFLASATHFASTSTVMFNGLRPIVTITRSPGGEATLTAGDRRSTRLKYSRDEWEAFLRRVEDCEYPQ